MVDVLSQSRGERNVVIEEAISTTSEGVDGLEIEL